MTDTPPTQRRVDHLIIGAGFAGLCAAIKLQEDGERDFVVIERGSDVGGTWRDNTYPGAACDVPSQLYSFSFARNPDWSLVVLPAARDPGLPQEGRATVRDPRPLRVRHRRCEDAAWDDAAQRWTVTTSDAAPGPRAP